MQQQLLFTAPINENNAAFIDGTTDENTESASYILTLPLDISLWHRRLAHQDYNSVKNMISKQLVTGIDIKSKQIPDPICEPCLSGKMNANPFPVTRRICESVQNVTARLREAKTRYQTARVRSKQLSIFNRVYNKELYLESEVSN